MNIIQYNSAFQTILCGGRRRGSADPHIKVVMS